MKHNAAVPDIVTAGLDTVALRMPDLKVTRELLKLAGVPVAAPSANLSGRPSPTNAEQVYADFNGLVSAVVDGGACSVGIESTVLDLTARDPLILRPGTVTREDLEDVIQSCVQFASEESERPLSPGMKYRHYAPRAQVKVLPWIADQEALAAAAARAIKSLTASEKKVGLLAPEFLRGSGENDFVSLGSGDAVEYARLLYKGLHALDAAGVDVILCPGIEAIGIGYAVMNRLLKAGELV